MAQDYRSLAIGASGTEVHALQARLLDSGATIALEELAEGMFGSSTRTALMALQQQHNLLWVHGVLDAPTMRFLDAETDRGRRFVSGRVLEPDGRPATGVTVRAFDRDLRSEQPLGNADTDVRGYYLIEYTAEAFAKLEQRGADVFVRVFDGRRRLTDPPVDQTVFNAPRLVSIVVRLPAQRTARQTQLEHVLATVGPLLGEVSWTDLAEDREHSDVTFLVGETRLPAERIEHAAVSHRLSAQYDAPVGFFYALLATNVLLSARAWSTFTPRLHVDLDTPLRELFYDIVLLPEDAVRTAVELAVRRFIVPSDVLDRLPETLKVLERHREEAREYLVKARQEALVAHLQGAFTSPAREEVLALLAENPLGDFGSILDRLRKAGTMITNDPQVDADVARLILTDAVGDAPAIIEHLQRTHAITKLDDQHKLATLDQSQWEAAIRAGSSKDKPAKDKPGKDDKPAKDTVRRQAQALMRGMARRYPTTAFATRLAADAKPPIPHAEAVAEVLRAHPEFDLATGNVAKLLSSTRVETTPEAQAALRSTQRVFKIAPRYEQTTALMAKGIASAAQIHAQGRTRFMATALETGEFTTSQAEQAYHSASDLHGASVVLAGQLASASGAGVVAALQDQLDGQADVLEQVTKDFPNFKSLFLQGDMCECEDCRSVHGAAAYLVDALEFVKHRLVVDTTAPPPQVATKSAKDVLFARRPDLGDLDLNCTNTNTPLPYLDVVCELLEDAVAPDAGVPYSGAPAPGVADAALVTLLQAQGWAFTDQPAVFGPDLNGCYVVRDTAAVAKLTPDGGNWRIRRLRQTFGTAEQVGAAPEYLNEDAYTTLAAAVYAFALPFDLAQAETRAYFGQFDLGREDLMRLLQVSGAPSDEVIAAEGFGLSDAQRELITTAKPGGQKAIWNTPTAQASNTLKNVDRFVTRAGIEFTDLVELLDLEWIDGGLDLFVRSLDNTCDLAAKEIVNLNDTAVDRLHRFLRLRPTVGWASATLDRAIRSQSVGKGKLNDACLVRLSLLAGLSTDLGLTPDAVLDLLDPLDPTSQDGTYWRAFLDASAVGTVDAGFQPDALAANEAAETTTPGSGIKLSAHAEFLALALGNTAADTALLVGFAGADPALTTASVSRSYAGSRLARAVRLPVTDLVGLVAVTGKDPLASLAELRAFVDMTSALTVAGTPVGRLRYLLRHEADDLSVYDLPPATVPDLVTALDSAYATAKTATASPVTAGGTPSENAGKVKTQLAQLPGLTATDLATLQTLLTDAWADTTLTEAAFVDTVLAPFVDTTPIKAALTARAAAADPKDAAQNAVLTVIADEVSAYLYRLARLEALTAAVAAALGIPAERVDVLLGHAHLKQPASAGAPLLLDVLLDDATSATAVDLKQRSVQLLHMIVTATPEDATDEDVAWLLDNAAALGWLEWDALPYDTTVPDAGYQEWARTQAFLTLLQQWPAVTNTADPTSPYQVRGLFDAVLDGASTAAGMLGYLAMLAGLDADTLIALDTQLGLSTPDLTAYQDPATVTRLTDAAAMLRQLGLDVPTAVAVTKPVLTLDDATAMRAALKTRYADADWLPVLKQVQGGLRERRRDALVAYLLATNPDLKDSTDLYDYFLIDVEMGACMDTSRIVQAHATVQLFVLRCLMGLEPTSVASVGADDGWKQWDWMANFRVWEANRKIFLWPENWIAPDIRDEKTELFVALDNQLQQNPLTEDAVEDATTAYLEGLDDIAHVDVMAAHYMTVTKTLHVFARTKGGDPTVYYHREFQQERYWTPWTTVPLDIAGDHLLAFDRNNRLTLAWPIFTSETDQTKQPPDTPDPAGLSGGKPNSLPDKHWAIQLAVSELSGDAWRPKKVSKGSITTSYQQNLPEATEYNFFVWGLGTGQAITCVGPSGTVGSFALTGCKGYPEPTSAGFFNGPLFPQFKDSALRANRFAELNQDATNDLAMASLLDLNGSKILDQTPGLFTITHPMQMTVVDWVLLFLEMLALSRSPRTGLLERGPAVPLGTLMPWFYGDYDRTYVVVPGFYQRQKPREVPGNPPATASEIKKTFSDVLQLVQDILALIAKYVQKYQADPSQPVADVVEAFFADPEAHRIWEELKVYRALRYGLRFANFYHPLVCLLRSTLNSSGIPAMLDRDLQLTDTGFSFAGTYQPTGVVVAPYPRENFDFELDGAYSAYNWELFFHLPFDIARRLSTDGQYEEARNWYHYIFDPVGATDAPIPRRYWKTKPFFLTTPAQYVAQRIDSIMNAIAADPSGATIGDLAFAVEQWRDDPFKPDVVARSRPVAYQIAIVTSYVQNLVDWGDSLFRQFTRESITQATQMYVLAEKLLGRKPRIVPPVVEPPAATYNQLEADVDLFGNALLDLENLIPDLSLLPHGGAELPPPPATLASLYFCIPPNENLLALWDVVADRLLKIRTCRNIDGVQASLALFSPPIDPGALVRAAAAGLDISAFVAGLGAPLPHYRFHVMTQKATELTQQVASLGMELLGVLEKRDAEKMARLRADHEVSVLTAMRAVKTAALDEAAAAVVALQRGRDVAQKRYDYYSTQDYMNTWEGVAVTLNGVALLAEVGVTIANALAGGLKLMPTFTVGGAGFGGSPVATVATGGESFGGSAESAASVLGAVARIADKGAGMAATQGGYQRRQDEWDLQAELATRELAQIDQQIANANLHIDTLNKDLAAHDVSAANAASARALMHSKYTNQELYEWMLGKISSVYYAAYKLAFDTAKKAERCFDYELATDTSYIGFGYWDSLKKGLMTHQALLADIKRMESAYLDANAREYELTKHISLAELDPGALMALKITGSATIQVPELVYAMDHPSHYFRRIRSVAMSLVCSAGPYTTVGATLSLVSNRYRKSTAARQGASTDKDKYAEDPGNDTRFAYNVGSMASVATSTAVSDSGLFELNFHDERYLPFEGAGAVGTWQVQLPTVLPQFDRDTISDLVLHVRYTAREGGSTFRTMVEKAMVEVSNEVALSLGRTGWYVGLSVRDQFPDAWWQLQQTGSTQVTLTTQHLPYAVRSLHPAIASTTIAARVTGAPPSYPMTVNGAGLTLNRDPLMKALCLSSGATATLGTPLTLAANTAKLEDLMLLVHYTITA